MKCPLCKTRGGQQIVPKVYRFACHTIIALHKGNPVDEWDAKGKPWREVLHRGERCLSRVSRMKEARTVALKSRIRKLEKERDRLTRRLKGA